MTTRTLPLSHLEASPDGARMYSVWVQWLFSETGEEFLESCAIGRRIWWIDEFIPTSAWTFEQGGRDGTAARQ